VEVPVELRSTVVVMPLLHFAPGLGGGGRASAPPMPASPLRKARRRPPCLPYLTE